MLKCLLRWRTMKINITATNFQKDFVLPLDAHFVGITLINENMSLDIIKIKNYSSEKYEEMVLDENTKLIFHYYSSSKAKEILESFDRYKGLRCIEVHNSKIDLVVSI